MLGPILDSSAVISRNNDQIRTVALQCQQPLKTKDYAKGSALRMPGLGVSCRYYSLILLRGSMLEQDVIQSGLRAANRVTDAFNLLHVGLHAL